MNDDDLSQLQQQFDDRTRSLTSKAASGEPVTPEELKELDSISKLLEHRLKALTVTPKPRRPAVVALLALTLVVVSVLLFAEVPDTEIELEVEASELSFVSRRPQVLTDLITVTEISAYGAGEIGLPRAGGRPARAIGSGGGAGVSMAIAAATEGDRRGTVTIGALMLPPGTRFTVVRDMASNQYRLSFSDQAPEVTISVNGPVDIALDRTGVERVDFTSPRSIILHPGSERLELAIGFADAGGIDFSSVIVADTLEFERRDEFVAPDRTIVSTVSTLDNGAIYYESLDGEELTLRPGQQLRFGRSLGEVRALELRDDHIGMNFGGTVSEMSTGPGVRHRSLMPSYLEWLSSQHSLAMLWGTALYCFGVGQAAIHWWRKK